MSNLFIRIGLFLSSYFPLILIFCILLVGKYPWWIPTLLLALGIASLLIMTWFFWHSRRFLAPDDPKITQFQRRDSEVMGYIASYLVPFVTFPFDKLQQLAALLIFFLVLLIIYVNSNLVYINPILNLAGYHLYEVSIEHSSLSYYLIARKRLVRNQPFRLVHLSDEILLEK